MKTFIKIGASILSANFGSLADESRRLEDSGVDAIHIDIMDGHFVPNLTLGPKAVAAINRSSSLFLDVHLMIYNPFEFVEKFIESGADLITFHFEATEDVLGLINYVRKCNKLVGLAFNPETSIELVEKFLDKVDLVLFMAVNPGFCGQKFISSIVKKIAFTKRVCDKFSLSPYIQVDGGINPETAKICVEAGANFLVSGNYIYSYKDIKEAVLNLKNCMNYGRISGS